MVFKIFLSYSTKDSAIAKRTKDYFERIQGVSIFLSEAKLILGRIDEAILKEIRECDFFIVLYSKDSHNSNYVQQEIGAARANNKMMIAVSLDPDIKPDAMLQGINYLSAYDEEKQKVEMPKLFKYVQQEAQKKANLNALIGMGLIFGFLYLLSKGSSSETEEY